MRSLVPFAVSLVAGMVGQGVFEFAFPEWGGSGLGRAAVVLCAASLGVLSGIVAEGRR